MATIARQTYNRMSQSVESEDFLISVAKKAKSSKQEQSHPMNL
jgi:hypothetical protein